MRLTKAGYRVELEAKSQSAMMPNDAPTVILNVMPTAAPEKIDSDNEDVMPVYLDG